MSNIKEKNINSDLPPRLLGDNETYLGKGTIVSEDAGSTVTTPDVSVPTNNKKKDK